MTGNSSFKQAEKSVKMCFDTVINICVYIYFYEKTCVFKVARQRDKKRDFVACSDHMLFSLRN